MTYLGTPCFAAVMDINRNISSFLLVRLQCFTINNMLLRYMVFKDKVFATKLYHDFKKLQTLVNQMYFKKIWIIEIIKSNKVTKTLHKLVPRRYAVPSR